MRIKMLRLCNFRNIEFAEAKVDFPGVWIFGRNAQGKTNLLESLGLLGALRSFRTSKLANMIRYGQGMAQVCIELEHEFFGESKVLIEIAQGKTKVSVNDKKYEKLADFIGVFPVVVLSSDDIKLARGAPLERRKFIDMLISSLDMEYFEALKTFHSVLSQRNILLKDENSAPELFDAFELQMAEAASIVSLKREQYLNTLAEIAQEKYALLCEGRELAKLSLKPDVNFKNPGEYLKILQDERKKDAINGSTSSGPHRDDFSFLINQKNIKEFASEGQQRSIVLSLKLGQFDLLKRVRKSTPVLLCDDILNELDEHRRTAFWKTIDSETQVMATSTSPSPNNSPLRSEWKTLSVQDGKFFE